MAESRRMLAALGLGLVLSGAACGGSTFSGRSAAAPIPSAAPASTVQVRPNAVLQAKVQRAVVATTAMHSARASISVTLTGLGDDAVSAGEFDMAGTGRVDLTNGNADLALSVPRFDRVSGGGTVEQRIVGGVVFAKLPADVLRRAGLPATVAWLRLDPHQIAGAGVAALSQSEADPARALQLLGASSVEVRAVGAESVRGVTCTHYSASIDLSAAGVTAVHAQLSRDTRTELARLESVVGPRRIGVEVWLDAAGRARRVVVTMPLAAQPARHGDAAIGPDAMLRVQGDFYGFGGAATVAAPPQDEVVPYSVLRLDALTG